MVSIKKVLFIFIIFLSSGILTAQVQQKLATTNFTNGLGIVAPDSLFSINFRFRTQLRSGYNTISSTDFSASSIEARVRRMRIRFEGFVINPKINYYVQLSMSRGDMDWVDNENSSINSSPNIVRDAVIIYKPFKSLAITFGQTKLPGNRQRVISSGDLQFSDRSIVNSTFNIDRDFGLQVAFKNKIGGMNYALKGAISSGEGRNSVSSPGGGLAYTGRFEFLPFGEFTKNGDYFEGDLEREPKPKISICAGFHHNEGAKRVAGTLGSDLYQSRNINSFIADFLLKYKGFALSAEYINRQANDPLTSNDQNQIRTIYVGEGKLIQMSYLFKNNFELAAKYAVVTPFSVIQSSELQRDEIGLGFTKYLRKHRVKLQGNIFYNTADDLFLDQQTSASWNATFQVEIGI